MQNIQVLFETAFPKEKARLSIKTVSDTKDSCQKELFEGQGTYFMANGIKMTGNWSKGTYLGGVPAPIQPSNKPQLKVWALIIGISGYSHMPALRYPDDDAYRIFAFSKALPEELSPKIKSGS